MKNFLPKNYMQYWWQKNIFLNMKFDWRNIYSLPRITTINMYLSSFQYKICNNILFLNKKLFVFWMKNTPSCSFCTKKDESLLHIFSKCTSVICLEQLFLKKKNLILWTFTPQTVLDLFGLWNDNTNLDGHIKNQVLLMFKLNIYNSRDKHVGDLTG